MTLLGYLLLGTGILLIAVTVYLLASGGGSVKADAAVSEDEHQIPRELLKKVKRIEISTRSVVNDVFSGEYHSVFKGRGMEFSEVREYQPGDDIRTIDWNVSARMGHPYVKIFEEERELTVMLLVDVSSSGNFGTTEQLKREVAAELSAVLAFSAIKNNDKVGLLIFSDKIEKFIPPHKGRKHVLRVIREILFYKPKEAATDLSTALEYLSKVIKRRSIAFMISDFLSEGYDKSLQVANKKHDLIAVSVTDPREISLPDAGMIDLEDAETGETILVDTSSAGLRSGFFNESMKERTKKTDFFKSIGVDHIDIMTDRSYVQPITKFFKMRAKRLAG